MGLDIAILAGIAICQGVTGYWAFHMSTEQKWARYVFGIVTFLGIGLIIWSGVRNSNSSAHIDSDLVAMKAGQSKILAALDLGKGASTKEILEKINKLSSHIYRVPAGTTYNVPNENCTINVENGRTDIQTEIYLPKEPFQGQVVTVRNMRNDKSNALIEIWGNGHKIGLGDRAYIVNESDAGGAGYLTMTFDVDQWSAAGLP